LSSNNEIGNTVAQYFQWVFLSSSNTYNNLNSDAVSNRNYKIGTLFIDEIQLKEIENVIRNLKSMTTVGSDGIPS